MADEFTIISRIEAPSPGTRRLGKSDMHVHIQDEDGDIYRVVVPTEIYTDTLARTMAAQQRRLKGMERLKNLLRGRG